MEKFVIVRRRMKVPSRIFSDHLFNDITYTLRSNKTECSPHPLPCYIRRKCNCLRFYGRRLATPGFDYWLWYLVWRWSEEFSPVTKSDWYSVDEFIYHTINAWRSCIKSTFSSQLDNFIKILLFFFFDNIKRNIKIVQISLQLFQKENFRCRFKCNFERFNCTIYHTPWEISSCIFQRCWNEE